MMQVWWPILAARHMECHHKNGFYKRNIFGFSMSSGRTSEMIPLNLQQEEKHWRKGVLLVCCNSWSCFLHPGTETIWSWGLRKTTCWIRCYFSGTRSLLTMMRSTSPSKAPRLDSILPPFALFAEYLLLMTTCFSMLGKKERLFSLVQTKWQRHIVKLYLLWPKMSSWSCSSAIWKTWWAYLMH